MARLRSAKAGPGAAGGKMPSKRSPVSGNSADSRYYGPLHKDKIVGTAFVSLWPLQTLGFLDGPDTAHARR